MSTALLLGGTLSLLVLPGLLVGASLRLRGWLLIGAAPAVTVGVAGVLGAWYGIFGITWSPVTALIGVLVLAVLGFGLGRLRPEAPQQGPRFAWYHHAGIAGGLALSSILGAVAVYRGSLRLDGIPQYWDAMFHSNAIRFIAESGHADSSALAAVAQPANTDFYYPHTYHLIGALLADLGVSPAQTVLNALSACLPAVFALSTVALLRVLFPRPMTLVAGALVATMFSAFPYDLINFGPLLPLALATAVSPAVVALMLRVVRAPSTGSCAALATGAVALLTTHPTAAVVAGIIGLFLVCFGEREDQVWRTPRRLIPLVATGIAVGVLAAPSVRGVLGAAGNTGGVDWPAQDIPGSAFGQLLLLNHESFYPQWWLAALVLVGASLARRRSAVRPFVVAAVLLLWLFVLAASYDTPLAQRLTSIWWNDHWRLAAAYVVPAAVLAALGLTWVVDRLRPWAERLWQRVRQWPPLPAVGPGARRLAVGAAVLAALVVLTDYGYLDANTERVNVPYTDGPTVSAGEEEAYRELARLWDGGTVLNDPLDGSAWAYALEDVPVLFKAPLTQPADPAGLGADRNVLLDRFDRGLRDEDVARAVEDLDVRWVIMGEGFASPKVGRAPGLDRVDHMRDVELVWSNDVADIYRIQRGPR